MRMRALFADRIANADLCPGNTTVEAWLATSWVHARVGEHTLPVIPLWGLKRALVAHDAHHVLLDYSTSLRGEVETAAWELASGGCRFNAIFWIDRVLAVLLGSVVWPVATWRAARRGWGCRNLYGMRVDELLAADVDQLRARIGR